MFHRTCKINFFHSSVYSLSIMLVCVLRTRCYACYIYQSFISKTKLASFYTNHSYEIIINVAPSHKIGEKQNIKRKAHSPFQFNSVSMKMLI